MNLQCVTRKGVSRTPAVSAEVAVVINRSVLKAAAENSTRFKASLKKYIALA